MKIIKSCILVLIVLSSCSSNSIPKETIYPKIVDSLGLQSQFDKTKWQLYLLHCNDTPKDINDRYLLSPAKPFSMYELRFDSLVSHMDTVEFYFDFFLNDSTAINCVNFREMKTETNNGLIFFSGVDSPLCYAFNCNDVIKSICIVQEKTYFDTTTNKFANPLQPAAISFLNKNKKALHPWLYKEAVKRGVIKDSF